MSITVAARIAIALGAVGATAAVGALTAYAAKKTKVETKVSFVHSYDPDFVEALTKKLREGAAFVGSDEYVRAIHVAAHHCEKYKNNAPVEHKVDLDYVTTTSGHVVVTFYDTYRGGILIEKSVRARYCFTAHCNRGPDMRQDISLCSADFTI